MLSRVLSKESRISTSLFLLLACLAFTPPAPGFTDNTTKPIVLALLPLTGSGADQGTWCRQGIELALREEPAISERIEVVFEDTAADPKSALSIFKRYLASKRLLAAITWGSGVGMVLHPLANSQQVLQIGVATGTPHFRSAHDFNFRLFHDSTQEAKFAAASISKRAASVRVALLHLNNEYAVSWAKSFAEAATGTLDITYQDSFEPGTTDLRTQILKALPSRPDLFVLASYPQEGAIAIRQMRELGFKGTIVTSGALLGGKNFFDLVGSAGEGVEIVLPDILESKESRSFLDLYERIYPGNGQVMNSYAAHAYDALKLLSRSNSGCPTLDRTCVRDALASVRHYPGASALITFDEGEDVSYPLAIFRAEGAKFVKSVASTDSMMPTQTRH